MRSIYIITRPERGGAQTNLAELLISLHNTAELFVVTGRDEDTFLIDHAASLKIPIFVLPSLVQPMSLVKDVRAVAEIVKVIRKIKPDLIHCHSSKAGFLGRFAARLTGTPAVFTAHGWGFTDGISWKRKSFAVPSEWLAGRWSSKIITVSKSDRVLALRYGVARADQLVTIHNGIRDIRYRATPATDELVRIAVVARFAPQKDHSLLMRALAGAQPANFRLVFIGDGPRRLAVEQEACELGLYNRVEFLGNRGDVAEILARSHIFVLPSNWEGLPISILEAMRAGLPVIASDVGGCGEAVAEGETGFLVPRGDANTLRDRLQLLLTNPQLRAKLGAAGRKRYEENFTFEQMLEKTLAVYDRVLAAKPTRQNRLWGFGLRSQR